MRERGGEIDVHGRIFNHSYKPHTIFYHMKTVQDGVVDTQVLTARLSELRMPYMGIEIEVEIPRENTITAAVDIVHKYASWIYNKRDSSIQRGFEMVTHPHSMHAWYARKEELTTLCNALIGMGAFAHTQGLHVHISKQCMLSEHKTKFQTFYDANRDKVHKIARRMSERYAAAKPPAHKDWGNALYQPNSKYMVVNWQPSPTVEVRIFQGSLDVSYILACIEFVHASYVFTAGDVSLATLARNGGWDLFCQSLLHRKDGRRNIRVYKDLRIYLRKLDLFTADEKEKKKCASSR